ncbi:membrane protein insertase YidC [Nitrospira sp.]|nr:membrane protein insertase YidC [Nitrospira sp.]
MDNRVIAFLIVSLLIIVGYDYLMKELGYLPSSTSEEQTSIDSVTQAPLEVQKEETPTMANASSEKDKDSTRSSAGVMGSHARPAAGSERVVRVETELYKADLSSRGGVIKAWELTQYTTAVDSDAPPVQLVYKTAQFPGPLSLRLPDSAVTKELQEGDYEVEQDVSRLDAARPTGRLTFRYRNEQSGLQVEKVLTFHYDSYLVDVAIKLQGVAGPVDVGLGANFGIVEWGEGFIGLIGPASLVDDKIEKDTPSTESERTGNVVWAALQDKYFMSVLIPRQASAVLVKKELDKVVSTSVRMPIPPSGGVVEARLYAGPKQYDTLRDFHIGLEDTIDFGWFIYGSWGFVKMVAKPLFAVLRTINEVTQNFGLTIILLTVALKLLFAPLQYKAYKSMKDMQLIQPKVAAVQEKFKDDRERLNKELISLYRDHKVNPVGGCLPMLLQMPVFVALFNILYMTIDLRQAPFMLWVKDLSVPDPYYVLPIIMGGTMVIQQKIMPTTMDPTQAKVMLVLPVMLTFLFLTFPAGLVLYWLTNNTLTIVQQFVTDRYLFKRPA